MIKSVLTSFRFSHPLPQSVDFPLNSLACMRKTLRVCVCVYLCIYIHTYPCISTYVQVNIFYTYIQIYIYIHSLANSYWPWKRGGSLGNWARVLQNSRHRSWGGVGWAARFLSSCLLGFCIHIVSGLDPSEVSLMMNSYPTVTNSSLRSSHTPIQNSKGTQIKNPLLCYSHHL